MFAETSGYAATNERFKAYKILEDNRRTNIAEKSVAGNFG